MVLTESVSDIRSIDMNQRTPLALTLITPTASTASQKHKKLINQPNNPKVKKLIGKLKNCKTGLIKLLTKLRTIRNKANGKKSPTIICGNTTDKPFKKMKLKTHEKIILNII